MDIQHVQKRLYWFPRDVTGAYQNFDALGAAYAWVSDTPSPPIIPGAINYYPLPLPDWFPQKALIVSASLQLGILGGGGAYNECLAWVDPGGVAYNSTTPPGKEVGADLARWNSIINVSASTDMPFATREMTVPIALDRTAGDLLRVELANSVKVWWLCLQLGWLVPNTIVPE